MTAYVTGKNLDERKNQILKFLTINPGSKKSDIAEHLGLTYRTTTKLIGVMKAAGEVFYTGSNHGIQYWVEPQGSGNYVSTKRDYVVTGDSLDGGLLFLNHCRPSGKNVVFDQCKENYTLLPVLRVMAGRRYG
jgi:subtilase family serine protease